MTEDSPGNRFSTPPDDCRPLQFMPSFDIWCGEDDASLRDGLRRLQGLGVGGIVTTVSLDAYLRNSSAWDLLRRGVGTACALGFRIWIYDEKGYPSGAAGGLVLENLPTGEALGLVRSVSPDGLPRYEPVRLYEGTHATENFYQKRPYINIIDPEAVTTFLKVTHDEYARNLEPLAAHVEAFFTDEPSLISAWVPRGKDFPPALPWHPRLPGEFSARKGYDLLSHLESLFADTGEIDRKIRCDFYEVIADLCAETYFGQLQEWCRAHGVSSSGHLLGEETLVWQTLFEGDPFPAYRRFDIPGIDMILSDPARIMRENFFLVPKLAGSAARLSGKPRVMCEISDFLGALDGKHATVDQMTCTAGLLSALGVTDFVSMYQPPLPSPRGTPDPIPPPLRAADFEVYATCVARLRSVFSGGVVVSRIALLHPLSTVWAHFTPSRRSMYEPHPDPVVESVDRSFADLCRDLLQHRFNFDIVDERTLSGASVEGATVAIHDLRYDAIVLPRLDTLRVATLQAIVLCLARGVPVFMHSPGPQFAAEGPLYDARVRDLAESIRTMQASIGDIHSGAECVAALRRRFGPGCELSPPSRTVLCFRIERTEGTTYFLVNPDGREYSGEFEFPSTGSASLLNPVTGTVREITPGAVRNGCTRLALALRPFEFFFVLFSPLLQAEERIVGAIHS